MNNESISAAEVVGIIRRMDTSGDMTVSYEEWQLYFTPAWPTMAADPFAVRRASAFSAQSGEQARSLYDGFKSKEQLLHKYSTKDDARMAVYPMEGKEY